MGIRMLTLKLPDELITEFNRLTGLVGENMTVASHRLIREYNEATQLALNKRTGRALKEKRQRKKEAYHVT